MHCGCAPIETDVRDQYAVLRSPLVDRPKPTEVGQFKTQTTLDQVHASTIRTAKTTFNLMQSIGTEIGWFKKKIRRVRFKGSETGF